MENKILSTHTHDSKELEHKHKSTINNTQHNLPLRTHDQNEIETNVPTEPNIHLKLARRYSLNSRLGLNSNQRSEKESHSLLTGSEADPNGTISQPPRYSITKRIHTSDDVLDVDRLSILSDHGHRPLLTNKPWYVILPSNTYRIAWDIVMTWLLVLMAFYVPFRVCMYWNVTTSESMAIFIFETCTDVAFGIDILLNFITAYEDRKTKIMVTNPRKIILHYLRTFFILDLLATIPFTRILSDSSLATSNKIGKLGRLPKMVRLLRAMRLLKLLRVYKLHQFILKLDTEYNIHHGVTRMTKMIMVVMLVTHIVACFWYLVGVTGGDDPDDGGWMFRYDMMYENQPISVLYVASLYWAFSTLTTVGYGDISAKTPAEQCYSMVMMFLGVSWFAYVSSSMASIMSSFDAQAAAVRDKMICVSEFIRAAKLPPALGRQVRNYFDFKLGNSQKSFLMSSKNFDADQILYELSSSLRADILLHVERHIISKIPFFKDKVPQFIADAISMFQPLMVFSGDFIVKEGTQADEMFFLTKGTVSIYHNDEQFQILEEGSYFGEIGCIYGGVRSAAVKAITNCELQALSRRNLNILLAEYPAVGHELRHVADKRTNCNIADSTHVTI